MQEIDNLRDFVRWLVIQEQEEEENRVPEAKRIAHRWTIFPFQEAIYVGVATGLSGQKILDQFPELVNLRVSLPENDDELPEGLQNLSFKPHLFYYGPFSQEDDNL